MAISIGMNLAPDARAAADEFIKNLNQQAAGVVHLSEVISEFNKDGKLISETVKAITSDGQKMDVIVKQVGQTFELMTLKADRATESLRQYQEQQKQLKAAQLKATADTAEGVLQNIPGLPSGATATPGQATAVEAAFQRVRAAIESGKVSLQRFQEIYNQISANPKAILPNLTKEEAGIASAVRTLVTGFDTAGASAKGFNSQLSSIGSFVLRIFSSQVIGRITGFLSSALDDGIKSAKEFSIRIAEIGTISQSSGLSMEQWASGIRAVSEAFGNSQTDVAEAAYQAISNQVVKGAESFDFLASAAKFSRTTVSTLADSVNLASSAIKGFNLPVSDTEKIFASFFKTIELGRLRAKDIADSFGRVSGLAHQAGVSLDEVNAALATITNRAVPPTEAMTLINNVILKLLRPTEDMKKLLKEWGVASGSAAIATFGFGGVLSKLNDEAERGGARLGELFNQIRAVRGVTALTGNAFGEFEANKAEIKDAQSSYDKAAELVAQSFGQRFKVEMNKVAVFFTEEFGDQIIKWAVQAAEFFGGLDNVIRTLTTSTLALVKAGVAFSAGLALMSGLIPAITSGIATMTGATYAQTAAFYQSKVAQDTWMAAASNVSALAAGFTLGYMIGQYLELDQLFLSNAAKARELLEVYSKLEKQAKAKYTIDAGKDKEANRISDIISQEKDAFNARYQLALTYYASQIKLSQNLRDRATQNLKDITDATKIASKSYFDVIGLQLADMRKEVNEADQMIKASLKSSEGLARKTGDEIFGKRLGFASEGFLDSSGFVINDQKVALIKGRINELQDLARQKMSEGTKQSTEDARKIYDELRQAQGTLLDSQVSKQRKEFDEAVRRGGVTPTDFVVDPITGQIKERFEFVVRTADYERQIVTIKNEQLAAEENLRKIERERIRNLEAEQLAEKEKLRTVQQAFTALEKINLLDKQGNLKDEFKDERLKIPGGPGQGQQTVIIPGALKALDEFDRQAAIIRKASENESVATQAQIFSTLQQQRMALEKQANAVIINERQKADSEQIEMAKKATDNQLTLTEEKIQQGKNAIQQGVVGLGTEIEKIKTIDLKNDPTQGKGIGIEQLGAALNRFNKDTSSENLTKLKKEFDDFSAAYENWVKISKGKPIGEMVDTPELARFEAFKKAMEGLQAGFEKRQEGTFGIIDIKEAGDKFSGTLTGIPAIMERIQGSSAAIAPKVIDNITTITNTTQGLIDKLEEARQEILDLNLALPALRQGLNAAEAPGGHFGGAVRYLSAGGFAGFRARGSDTQPAMLDPNEFIMNAGASKQFAPILRGMNQMASEYMPRNSNVTNVGDINLTVQGGSNSTQTIRQIGRGLKRELRRGTISLGNK